MSNINDVVISRMRLVLSTTALVVFFGDMPEQVIHPAATLVLLGTYVVYSAIFSFHKIGLRCPLKLRKSRHWIDVVWFSMIIAVTDPHGSVLFPFFLFAILCASFQEGFREGVRVTVVATILYLAIATVVPIFTFLTHEWERPALRAGFLLVFGYVIAHWGHAERTTKRNLALLRDVSKVSNPRFGVDQTISLVMDKIREHFHAGACFLVQYDPQTNAYTIRESSQVKPASGRLAKSLPASVGTLLMQLAHWDAGVFLSSSRHGLRAYFTRATCRLRNRQTLEWHRDLCDDMVAIADALSVGSYLTASSLSERKLRRLYVCAENSDNPREDASFLVEVMQYAFSTITNIEVLDRLATDAAQHERRKISYDLHDTTIQPYVGLQLGLQALRDAEMDIGSLKREIEKLAKMTSDVIADLRHYANRIRSAEQSPAANLLASIQRTVHQFEDFYGIKITLISTPHLTLNDRLAAEVLQMVNEGLSNIRKHTQSQHAIVSFKDDANILTISIENEQERPLASPFVPRSLFERSRALGGRLHVDTSQAHRTVLNIEIHK